MRHFDAMKRPWTTTELAYLREHRAEGLPTLAAELGRSVSSVRSAASRARISLRRPGSRRGLVLGQPRDLAISRRLRDSLLDPSVDGGLVAERMRLDESERLCPCCGQRPVRSQITGFCGVCHRERLASAHAERLAEIESQRGLWRLRQRVSRARRAQAAALS